MDRRRFIRYAVASSAVIALPEVVVPMGARASNEMDVPSSIPADGSVDVTADLAGFIRSVPDGSTIRLPGEATYRIEGTVEIWRHNRLVIEGNGATLIASTPGDPSLGHQRHPLANRSHLKFIGGSDITVRDLRITGANVSPGRFTHAYNSQHGIVLAGVKGALIERCTITNVYGDSVYLGNERPGRINSPCEDIFVMNNTATGSGRQGMTLCYGTNIWFVDNTIDDTGFTAFDFEPNSHKTPCSHINVIGNTIGTHRACFLAARGRAPVNDVVVSGNMSTAAGLGIQAGHKHMRQGGWVVEGNHSTEKNGAHRFFGFTCMDDVTVTGNDVAARGSAVRINDCTVVRVVGNRFAGAKTALEVQEPDQRWYQGPSTDYLEKDNTLSSAI
jgi:Right handed beta helix region